MLWEINMNGEQSSSPVEPPRATVEKRTRGKSLGIVSECGAYVTFWLADGRPFIVDAEDAAFVAQHKWRGSGKGNNYPAGRVHGKDVKLHRVLAGVTDPCVMVDHRDRNPLNARRSNLRIATSRQNAVNHSHKPGASGLNGVRQRGKTWTAFCHLNNKQFHCGTYSTAKDAATARDAVMRAIHGDFAATNERRGLLN